MRWFVLINFFIFTSVSYSQSQLNDCTGAIEVCGNGTISSNASGFGLQEINSGNSCSSFEHNSLWIRIEITKSGTLGFNLKPTSSSIDIDYDFFVFGPNSTCGDLGTTIRCSTTNPNAAGLVNNHTGMKDEEVDLSEGPGPNGNGFVKSLNVSPGESYYVVIDRPIGQSPFELEWTGTSTTGSSPFPEGVEVNQPEDMVQCGINGSAEFDLFQNRDVINNQPNIIVEYFRELTDAIDQTNPIQENFISTVPRKTIFVRVENTLTGCFQIVDFDLLISEEFPIVGEVEYILCDWDSNGSELYILESLEDEILNGLGEEEFVITYFETINAAYENLNPVISPYSSRGGTIFARVEDNSNPECFNISEIQLGLNSPNTLSNQILENIQFGNLINNIIVDFTGNESYEFALNNSEGPYQDLPVFEDVAAGNYSVFVRNIANCEISSFQVSVIGFNGFFTPNNDSFNDFWDLKLAEDLIGHETIKIFDRYGKFLAEISPNSIGWDGTSRGKPMPPADYWFFLDLKNGERLKGHFSLIR